MGDVIRAEGVSGQVEQMTMWVTAVRDLQGTAHFTPNGEIKVTSNLAKQWEVAREPRRRIKARFDHEGIQNPYPHRIVITRPKTAGTQ